MVGTSLLHRGALIIFRVQRQRKPVEVLKIWFFLGWWNFKPPGVNFLKMPFLFCDSQSLTDLTRGCGLIECVEMDARDTVVQKVGALLRGIMKADLANGFRRVTGSLKGFEQAGRVACAARKFGHALHRREAGHRHDTGHNGNGNASQIATFPKIVEIPVFKEELRANVVSTGVDLLLKVVHFKQAIGSGRMAFRKTGDADSESTWIGVTCEFLDEADQISSLGKGVAGVVVVGSIPWRISPESQDIADSSLCVALQNHIYLRFRVTHAREVRNRVEGRLFFEPEDKIVC